MAFTPTTPTSGKIRQPDADQALNTFHILSIDFALMPGEPTKTKMKLKWSEGYMDGETYVPVNHKQGFWDAEEDSDLVDALNAVTTGGTMYNEVKSALWDFLQTKGEIGEGSIS
jgi:hypothetical protein